MDVIPHFLQTNVGKHSNPSFIIQNASYSSVLISCADKKA
jgi:hypothetical protein